MKRNLSLTILGLVAVLGASCGKDNDGKSGDSLAGERGVVQGVVVNAITGERVKVPTGNGAKGINVLVNHTHKTAVTKENGYAKEDAELVRGEYYISNVPVGQAYPIVVNIDGYQTFEGMVLIPKPDDEFEEPTDSSTNSPRKVKKAKPTPTLIANIAVFPEGTFTKDLVVKLRHLGTNLVNANVVLKPFDVDLNSGVSAASLVDDKNFVVPYHTRIAPQTGKSNDDGEVLFKGKDLVLGQKYKVVVYTGRKDLAEKTADVVLGAGVSRPPTPADDEFNRFIVQLDW